MPNQQTSKQLLLPHQQGKSPGKEEHSWQNPLSKPKPAHTTRYQASSSGQQANT